MDSLRLRNLSSETKDVNRHVAVFSAKERGAKVEKLDGSNESRWGFRLTVSPSGKQQTEQL